MIPGDDRHAVARQETRRVLRAIRYVDGASGVGIAADGYICGIVDVVREALGPEAAYAMLQRHADAAAMPLVTSPVHMPKG